MTESAMRLSEEKDARDLLRSPIGAVDANLRAIDAARLCEQRCLETKRMHKLQLILRVALCGKSVESFCRGVCSIQERFELDRARAAISCRS